MQQAPLIATYYYYRQTTTTRKCKASASHGNLSAWLPVASWRLRAGCHGNRHTASVQYGDCFELRKPRGYYINLI